MNAEIYLANNTDGAILDEIFELRHRVFFETLKWAVHSQNGKEKDLYDSLKAAYITSGSNGHVDGTMRLLPTTGPYMLKNTFPQLLQGEAPPRSSKVWEISRFAVEGQKDIHRASGTLNLNTLLILRKLYDFGIENGLSHFVFVTSAALERLLKRIGLPMYRFGNGKAVRIGNVLSVACWLEVNDQFEQAVFGNRQLTANEERKLA